jgi:hypothetical protein
MVNYALQYGQLLGWIKKDLAIYILDYDPIIFFSKYKQSENEELSLELYDRACEVKYNYAYSRKNRLLSYLFSLLDCVYCIGFWISLIATISIIIMGYPMYFTIIPITTYFMIEKI